MKEPPQEIVVDMARAYPVKAFTYLPRQSGLWSIVKSYEWQISNDGKNWQTVAEGEFAIMKANPVEQIINLSKPVNCRYFKFIGKSEVEDNYISAAEVGVMK